MARALDLATRYFWRALGKPIDIAGAEAWLDAPATADGEVGEAWLTALERAGRVRVWPDDGLLVFVDEEGVLRTDHRLALGTRQALRLHYRLERIATRPSDTP